MLGKNVLVIDIGNYYIKIVSGKSLRTNKVILKDTYSIKTPSDCMEDGQIISLEKVSNEIKSTLIQHNVKSNQIVFTLASTSIITREIFLPYGNLKELEEMLQYEVHQHFPTTLDEYIIQHKKLEDHLEDENKKSKVLVAAVPKVIVEGYLQLANKLDLKPLALDLHGNAISKLFNKGVKINNEALSREETIGIIDLGYEVINVNIIDGGVLQFNRLLMVGGRDIDVNLANHLNISFQEAEKEKLENYEDPIVENAIKYCLDNWMDEIQSIFRFYTSRSPSNKVDKIYLIGGHAGLKGINEHFEAYFNMPVEGVNQLSNVTLESQEEGLYIGDYLNAIGAIIRK